MSIKCNNCELVIGSVSFSMHLGVLCYDRCKDTIWAKIISEAILLAIKNTIGIRGPIDGELAAWANIINLQCPRCKTLPYWDKCANKEKSKPFKPAEKELKDISITE